MCGEETYDHLAWQRRKRLLKIRAKGGTLASRDGVQLAWPHEGARYLLDR